VTRGWFSFLREGKEGKKSSMGGRRCSVPFFTTKAPREGGKGEKGTVRYVNVRKGKGEVDIKPLPRHFQEVSKREEEGEKGKKKEFLGGRL